ncbi:MAG TPA: ABC transporter permease [Bryobacteraceae bacterium]|jgi:predicted permease
MQALRHAVRRLGRAPGFTAIAVATVAIGIGANTAIFSVVNGVLIKPLPYPHSESLVGIWHTAPGVPDVKGFLNCSPTMLFTYREESRTIQNVGLWSTGEVSVTGMTEPEQAHSLYVTYGTLDALGVSPESGRWFSQADDKPGAPDTVILMHGYWQKRFAGDKSTIGRAVTVDSKPRTVIGVMPRDFRFMNVDADLILPQRFDRNKIYLGNFSYQGLARLKPGVTLQAANADVARMLGIWIKQWPTPPGFSRALFENAHLGPKVQPLKEDVVGDIGSTLWVLMGTIGLVLLIACANVANLLLVRAEGRQQELAVRAALGAGWARIARELLLESLLLGMIGGMVGLALAYGALRLLVAMGPATLPRLQEITIDPLVLAFALTVSLFSGLLFGVIPVLKYAGPHVIEALRGGGRAMSHGRERRRARDVLVVIQVGLALVLLIGSGLMIRTFQALRSVQPGFSNPEQIQMLRISIPSAHVKDPARVMKMQQQMMERLAAIPGVTSVGFSNSGPLEGFNPGDVLYAEDKSYGVGQIPPIRRFRFIAPGFLETTGTPMIVGHGFEWADLWEKRNVALVSENMAREMWGSPRAALGKRVREGPKEVWREIVGVVGDVHDDGMQEKAPAMVYFPAMVGPFWEDDVRVQRSGTFVIRTNRAGTESLLGEARRSIWQVDNSLPVYQVRTLKEVYDRSLARTEFTLVMLGIAGAMALLLGMVGIYGVIAYAVLQRTREIGIRMALGAEPVSLRTMFVRQGLVLAGIGVVAGLMASTGVTRLMKSLLFGIPAMDPTTYAAVAAMLISIAAFASYLPARRATQVDPVETLRAE